MSSPKTIETKVITRSPQRSRKFDRDVEFTGKGSISVKQEPDRVTQHLRTPKRFSHSRTKGSVTQFGNNYSRNRNMDSMSKNVPRRSPTRTPKKRLNQ
jgi:hypothetical protein